MGFLTPEEIQWITKFVKNRGNVIMRVIEGQFWIQCWNCATKTSHTKHADKQGNTYHFCDDCGQHN